MLTQVPSAPHARENPEEKAYLASLEYRWRNFTAERAKAQQELEVELQEDLAEAARLKQGITVKRQQFKADSKRLKAELAAERDEAVKAELRTGRPAQDVLREIGSSNTVWIYGLLDQVRKEQAAADREKLLAVHEDSYEPEQDEQVENIKWEHHDHTGVHRWLVSTDRTYFKKYGVEGTPHEGEWFIADTNFQFVDGSKSLYDATPREEMVRRTGMLIELLEGSYEGKKYLEPNRWTH